MARRRPERFVELGRVAGAYGVRGWIRVAGGSEALAACATWRIGGTGYAVEARKKHSGWLLAKLAGLGTREQALKLKGAAIEVERSAMPEPEAGHYYFADLIGLEVVNEAGTELGKVKALTWNGAHDVMEVAGDRTRLLPWVPAVVKSVDLDAQRIEVDWGADW